MRKCMRKYSVKNIFFKNQAKYEVRRLDQDLSLFFKKALYKVQVSG